MGTLLVAATLFATILTALGFGVLLGYTAIVAILRLFGRREPRPQVAAPTSTAKLVALTQ